MYGIFGNLQSQFGQPTDMMQPAVMPPTWGQQQPGGAMTRPAFDKLPPPMGGMQGPDIMQPAVMPRPGGPMKMPMPGMGQPSDMMYRGPGFPGGFGGMMPPSMGNSANAGVRPPGGGMIGGGMMPGGVRPGTYNRPMPMPIRGLMRGR